MFCTQRGDKIQAVFRDCPPGTEGEGGCKWVFSKAGGPEAWPEGSGGHREPEREDGYEDHGEVQLQLPALTSSYSNV